MKAKPVRLVYGSGYVQCSVEDATHVTLNIPGPTGKLTLPVIQRGSRDDTGCWTWNGSTEAPTLRPSVRTEGCSEKSNGPFLCHSWINDGAAQFLSDCSHDLVNQTVPLLEVPADGVRAAPAGFVLVPLDAPESLRGQLCGYGADLGYMDPRDRAVIVQRGAERWAEILRWAGADGVPGTSEIGKRSTSAATASGHEIPDGTAVAQAAASLPVANGGGARVASAGRPDGVGVGHHESKAPRDADGGKA